MAFFIFLIGLCFGSFVNMLVYRTEIRYGLRKIAFEGLDKDRSYCDYCGKQLSWYENIPVISWLLLKGRTKCCRKKLPRQYPIIELVTGILFLFFINDYLGMLIAALLVFSVVFDLKQMILPDFSTAMLFVCALIIWYFRHFGDITYFYSAIGAFIFLLILHLGTKGKGMGFGDVKLALFMGMWLGFPQIILAFYIAFISGAILGVGLIMIKRKKMSSEIPFGPFLILGSVVTYLYGKNLLYYVYRWF